MGISVTDRKKLWGRSGNRCAICKTKLVEEGSEPGGEPTIIGVEAHIVAQSPDGPRGDSPLTVAQRDSYSNLILLCPNDHARVDDRPHEYPAAELEETKKRHEKAIDASGQIDKKLQLREEQWAALIDHLDELMGWQTWDDDISDIFDPSRHGLWVEVHRRLSQASAWIFSRAWPEGHPRLREAIQTLGRVLNDFLATFNQHAEGRPMANAPTFLRTEPFYKTHGWLETERYDELARKYNQHVALIQDLALEVTRYGNYVARLVREEIDGSFRFNEGLLVVTMGPFDEFPHFPYHSFKPEFDEADLANGQPYRDPEQFRQDRSKRSLRVPDE